MEHIFVSYRRSDSSAVVGRVIDRMIAYFGQANIFRDIDSIDYGKNFESVITESISQCKVCLVIIGPRWINAKDGDGNLRLNDPDDWVANEISSALQQGLIVIPVLIDGASMPNASSLPESIKPLTKNNAATVRSDPDFDPDITRLFSAVSQHVEPKPIIKPQPHWKRKLPFFLAGFAVLIIAISLFIYTFSMSVENFQEPAAERFRLTIEKVNFFPESRAAAIKVYAFVNGIEFFYPSVAGVEWVEVGPQMSGHSFDLPEAENYDIRFEIKKRSTDSDNARLAHLVSQKVVRISGPAISERYQLHGFDPASRTRSGSVSAEVVFSIEP